MMTGNVYNYLTYDKIKYQLDSLSNTIFSKEIQAVLVVIGLPDADLFDNLAFEPCLNFEQEKKGGNIYYKLGVLNIFGLHSDIYIDTEQWNIWAEAGNEMEFLNMSLSSFLLFIEVYAHSVLTNYGKDESHSLSIEIYTQLKTQYHSIDSAALTSGGNLWSEFLESIKNFY
jgi:SUKH-4 immunity protein